MSARRRTLAVVGVLVVLAAAGGVGWWRSHALAGAEREQPISFNHKVHLAAKVDCLQCHEGILDAAAWKLPTLEVCASCHTDPPGPSPGKQRLAALVTLGRPLVWEPAMREPDHVFFPHQRHVDVAGLECKSCHAAIEQSTAPPRRNDRLSMAACIRCHAQHPERPAARRATTDCAPCHR